MQNAEDSGILRDFDQYIEKIGRCVLVKIIVHCLTITQSWSTLSAEKILWTTLEP